MRNCCRGRVAPRRLLRWPRATKREGGAERRFRQQSHAIAERAPVRRSAPGDLKEVRSLYPERRPERGATVAPPSARFRGHLPRTRGRKVFVDLRGLV